MWIKGGRILDPANNIDGMGDIHIQDNKIAAIYLGGNPGRDEEMIDATGLFIMPGLIDMHVHLREPGFEYKEDIYTGSLAAAAGGITTIACMSNTDPVNDNPAVTKHIIDRANTVGLIRILPVGAVTKGQKGKELSEMGLMKRAGIVAVSDDGQPVEDSSIMRRALEYASNFGLPLISHCQDKGLCAAGVMNEGALSSQLGLPGIPNVAEDIMIARDIALSEYTGVPIHITHVSTKGGLHSIRQAKARGLKVTCDVTPHHLLLTEDKVKTYNTNAKMYPPLRHDSDRSDLIEGLRDTTIDCIASDHAPHAKDEKDLDFDLAPFGIIGLQTLLPGIMKIHNDNKINLLKLLACVTINPARILGIDVGLLNPGSKADITIFNPQTVWTFTEDVIKSKSKNSPFLGEQFVGKVVRTIYNGKTVYSES